MHFREWISYWVFPKPRIRIFRNTLITFCMLACFKIIPKSLLKSLSPSRSFILFIWRKTCDFCLKINISCSFDVNWAQTIQRCHKSKYIYGVNKINYSSCKKCICPFPWYANCSRNFDMTKKSFRKMIRKLCVAHWNFCRQLWPPDRDFIVMNEMCRRCKMEMIEHFQVQIDIENRLKNILVARTQSTIYSFFYIDWI